MDVNLGFDEMAKIVKTAGEVPRPQYDANGKYLGGVDKDTLVAQTEANAWLVLIHILDEWSFSGMIKTVQYDVAERFDKGLEKIPPKDRISRLRYTYDFMSDILETYAPQAKK